MALLLWWRRRETLDGGVDLGEGYIIDIGHDEVGLMELV